MESADAEVHDADADPADVIGGPRALGGQPVESVERQVHHSVGSCMSCAGLEHIEGDQGPYGPRRCADRAARTRAAVM
jgi:hypothetical protein